MESPGATRDTGFKTSKKEVKQLAIAWLALTLAVTFLFTDPVRTSISPGAFTTFFVVSFVTAGAGFLLHELAHKVVAQRYGHWAEFRADYEMLVIAVVSGIVGFLFAAPGAVRISSRSGRGITARESGIISVAGPVTNLALFVVFFVLALVVAPLNVEILNNVARLGTFINAFLAAFNMLPFGPLDGRKVKRWNLGVFALTFVVSVVLALYSFGVF
ncbi:MAG: metalloprotease [Halobacteria archaeon]|nr:metalloprotease [Halobacteria archaeon]